MDERIALLEVVGQPGNAIVDAEFRSAVTMDLQLPEFFAEISVTEVRKGSSAVGVLLAARRHAFRRRQNLPHVGGLIDEFHPEEHRPALVEFSQFRVRRRRNGATVPKANVTEELAT